LFIFDMKSGVGFCRLWLRLPGPGPQPLWIFNSSSHWKLRWNPSRLSLGLAY